MSLRDFLRTRRQRTQSTHALRAGKGVAGSRDDPKAMERAAEAGKTASGGLNIP
jgi:hypothetical protein